MANACFVPETTLTLVSTYEHTKQMSSAQSGLRCIVLSRISVARGVPSRSRLRTGHSTNARSE